jgi:hypothetical protein
MKNRRGRAFKKRFAYLTLYVQKQEKVAFEHFQQDKRISYPFM